MTNPLKGVRVETRERHPLREMFEQITGDLAIKKTPAEINYQRAERRLPSKKNRYDLSN